MIKAVVFDLDGTLLDTLEDLRDSMNHILSLHGMPLRTTEEIRSFVGNGLRNLTKRSAVAETDDELIDTMFAEMVRYYKAHDAIKTKPYDGIPELLQKLKDAGVIMSVVSNKADVAVKDLCEHYYPGMFPVAEGAREGLAIKPAPDLVEKALAEMGVTKEEAVYIGDSEVDVATAGNSGLPCLTVLWGFRDEDMLKEAGAEHFVSNTGELYRVLEEM